ncbi:MULTISPECIES: reverse transcriptase N-terminal domain-containing protein [Streptomyces]|uniref:RNA-directed DNA polymerase n=2 Tax=Streptomyces bottropensis TaxID=42235 RepID=M3FHG9_9ACTN|nr:MULTISPECIES: reverse transcriptase N-terminal domain-containing protein [Streptomyces]EMF52370.1 RNA-directed DNA polymerase [Streptomyces bottropensis ATCC 25435]MZD22793.1 RNA-directed DNA polymerase [Streptomyces sp. SID5476]
MLEHPEPRDKLDAPAEAAVNGPEDEITDWLAVDWQQVEDDVRRLRQRIFTASQAGDLKRVRNLQKLMLRSRANTLLSVRRVTEINAGRTTAGIDGKVVLLPQGKAELADWMQRSADTWRARPVRRVHIPKAGGKKQRPLGIPVIVDRALQARALNALEPEWEARFEPKSYGFRPGRGCHDAIEREPHFVESRWLQSVRLQLGQEIIFRPVRTIEQGELHPPWRPVPTDRVHSGPVLLCRLDADVRHRRLGRSMLRHPVPAGNLLEVPGARREEVVAQEPDIHEKLPGITSVLDDHQGHLDEGRQIVCESPQVVVFDLCIGDQKRHL